MLFTTSKAESSKSETSLPTLTVSLEEWLGCSIEEIPEEDRYWYEGIYLEARRSKGRLLQIPFYRKDTSRKGITTF